MKLILAIIIFPAIIFGQNKISTELEKYMQAQVEINNFSGTILVSKNNSILLKKSFGLADYEWNVKNTIDTKYSLASVSKQFTAAAILQLVDKGKISLDDKLSKFFPSFPEGDSITIHMLLCHMSGLQMDFDELYLNKTSITQDTALKHIEQKKLLFTSGTDTSYSNIGYYLLARIVEKSSGLSFAEYLKKNIFDRANMNNTGLITNDELIHKRAKNYIFTEGKYQNNPYINWEYNIGHDGIYSTVEDLALWDSELHGTKILSAEMKNLMFTSYNEQNFGYGFLINPFYNHGHQLIAHDGGFFGAMTSLNRFTDDQLFVTVLSNNQSPSYIISYGLSAIALGKEVEIPYKHTQVEIDTKMYDRYVGQYGQVNILKIDGKLYYNNKETELLPESKTKFFRADNNDRTVEFIKDKSGLYNSIILTKGGVKEIIERNY